MAESIMQGRATEKAQKRALQAQERAQAKAELQAKRQERIGAMEKMRANMQSPDMMSLLTAARRPATQGSASTMLTQPYGTNNTLG